MSSPIVTTTTQAAVFSIVSSVLAQGITAYQSNSSLSLDWHPVFQFFIFAIISTPPNVLWQIFLESSFPGYFQKETQKQKEDTESTQSKAALPERLNWRNTLTKTLLDQSVGACANTFLLCAFIATWEQGLQSATTSIAAVVSRTRADFWPLVFAGWRFWPWVSISSFALVPDVATRNLIGGLAGIVWGIYLSLATGPSVKVATE
ncbi:integral membrane protein mpv17 pmp22 family [Grosmannia clavigera kw1407]|uniref:Integral membrane protein mpv17 pmp22 family n=1 Tax=Grosmannia clavigera (strain kw1407 / UAMH 11150) TaxID=655863 RepID=F0XK25_GROCL|nr:integral membrane protein mpv17 pmp22 family [Grosmannia clavigera kw1407]EFX02015.1 integral membrane protein mpv17 pmp22 family [Grosmannia clavigera kw1407]